VATQTAVAVGILPRINVGAILQFQSVASPRLYAMAAAPFGQPIVLAGERGPWGNPSFEVTMYAYDGRNQAKISLRSIAAPRGFWAAGKSAEGFPNPLVIDPGQAGHFLLTDTGSGISLQNTFTPPGAYYRVVPPGISSYLAYGFADTGGASGLFNLSIVG